MARRRPRTAVATATATARPRIDLRLLLRSALELGGATVDLLLLRPLRWLWRALPSSFRSRARRAIDDALLRGRRGLDSLHRALASLHRAIASLHGALSPTRHLRALRRLLLPPPPPLPEQQQPQEPPQEQQQEEPPPIQGGAWMYGRLARRHRPSPAAATATSSSPAAATATSTSHTQARTYTVNGVEVPEEVVNEYIKYCSMASTCSARCTVCHFCVFEGKWSANFIMRTSGMVLHCKDFHGHQGVQCGEPGCSVRVRAGDDQALHQFFCHQLSPGWWMD